MQSLPLYSLISPDAGYRRCTEEQSPTDSSFLIRPGATPDAPVTGERRGSQEEPFAGAKQGPC